jgi:hypothetical protein
MFEKSVLNGVLTNVILEFYLFIYLSMSDLIHHYDEKNSTLLEKSEDATGNINRVL